MTHPLKTLGARRATVAAGLMIGLLPALPAMAGFDQILSAPNAQDYVKITEVTGGQIVPQSVVRVGGNGAMGFKLPDGTVAVLGDLHSTRTDVAGIELTSYTPASGGQGAVAEFAMTEGNLSIDNTASPGTRIVVRTRDSVVEIPPGSNVVCVTALPAGATKPRRTLTAVRNGMALFRNDGATEARGITARRSIASNGQDGQPRMINHPYKDCCGALEDKRAAVQAGAPGTAQGMGPVAVYAPAPAPAAAVAPAAGGVAQAPVAGVPLGLIAAGAGAAAVAVGVGVAVAAGDGDTPAATATTTTTTTTGN